MSGYQFSRTEKAFFFGGALFSGVTFRSSVLWPLLFISFYDGLIRVMSEGGSVLVGSVVSEGLAGKLGVGSFN